MATIYDIATQPHAWLGGERRNDITDVGRQCFLAAYTIMANQLMDEPLLQAASSAMTKIVRDACAFGIAPGEFIETAKMVITRDPRRYIQPPGLQLTIAGVDKATSEALWAGWCDAMEITRQEPKP